MVTKSIKKNNHYENKTEQNSFHDTELDKYEMLQYFIAKLETRTDIDEVYKFLLEFLSTMVQFGSKKSESCIFLVNNDTLEFDLFAFEPENAETKTLKNELDWQIENGIVATCINNRKAIFSPAAFSGSLANTLIVPLTTSERILGLALLYTDIKEDDFERELLQVVKLASTQAILYIENIAMVIELKNTQARIIHTEKLSAIGQLAAGIAHEINNPTSYILSNCEILSEYVNTLKLFTDSSLAENSIEAIRKNYNEMDIEYITNDAHSLLISNIDGLKRITQIVANLKDFAHPDQKEESELCNLEENILKTLSIANNEIKYYAEVKTDFRNVSTVKCNPGEINQVFLNIIINAAQAIKELDRKTPGLISLRSYENESSVFFEIEDDGPGITEKVLPKIFDPFFTTKPVGKGTGLGLNIAYDIIVNKHHGEISANTEVGKGTTFVIQLPKCS
jgi:signal transduction histidine kinase